MFLLFHAFNTGMGGQQILGVLYASVAFNFSYLKVIKDHLDFQWIKTLIGLHIFDLHICIFVTLTTMVNKHRKLTSIETCL